jgi:DNA-binding HxlR family transcriptional regulator
VTSKKPPRVVHELPIRLLLDQIADKWSVLILDALCHGPLRFNELKRRLDGPSQKMLATTLRSLERNGIVRRQVLVAKPIAVEYEITKLGRTLEAPFAALHAWATENVSKVEVARASYEAGNQQTGVLSVAKDASDR